MAVLKYPLEKQDVYKGRVKFQELSVSTPIDKGFQLATQNGETTLAALGDVFETISSPIGPVAELYLPPAIQISDGVNYENFDLGLLPQIGLEAAIQNQSLIAGASAMAQDVGTGITDTIEAFRTGNFNAAAQVAAAKTSARFLSRDLQGFVSAQTRVVANPNTRVLFRNVNIREFTFAFELRPTSPAEAASIEAIIKFFRKNIYPESIPLGPIATAAYRFPNPFRITMFYGNRELSGSGMPRLLDSYLRSMTTNFNPTTMAMFNDGKFSEYSLQLNFVEAKTLTRNDVNAGY